MSAQAEYLLDYWTKVGLLIIFDSNGSVTMGRLIDVVSGMVVVRDITGLRHWINPDSIVRIMEVGSLSKDFKITSDECADINEGMPKPFSS